MSASFDDFRIVSRIYESARTRVLAAHRREDGAAHVLRLPQPGQPAEGLNERYERELHYRRTLNGTDVALGRHMAMPFLIIHDEGRVALRELLASSGPLDVDTWLRVAVSASGKLKALHALGAVHRDMHPGNLLWDPAARQVDIIDFEMAVPLVHVRAEPIDRHHVQGALPYLAPEMTGRMNIGVDYRSDLYMLGVILYEMLTGERPFTADDPLELIHQHMTATPRSPGDIRPGLPSPLSSIVLKLLAKSPEKRYQSAHGLEHDLRRALAQLEQTGGIDAFSLGASDFSSEYRASSVLYGRDRDRTAILAAQQKACSGARSLYFIGGYSGIGKTALARQLREPTLLSGGVYAEGKCDQYQRHQPYSAWSRALDSALLQLLAMPWRHRESVAEEIRQSVGSNGGLLVELVPTLDSLIGPQPAASALSAEDARNRLGFVFTAFMARLAQACRPLVIFLDDLQWMDAASLDLLQAVALSDEVGYLLVVAAYRDNEVDEAHPLRRMMQALGKEVPQCVTHTRLQNLGADDLARMIAGTLRMEPGSADELAAAVHGRTAGNPFYSHQLLKHLVDTQVLRFDAERAAWTWCASALKQLPLADNVIDLLLAKLRTLPEPLQRLLQLGACVGNRFAPAVLATAAGCSETEVLAALEPVLQEGLLGRDESALYFDHDRIQQAAYALTAERDRPELHLGIGRLLLAAETGELAQDRLFEIVSHFERGRERLADPAETGRVAALAAEAARRAQAASAHDVALEHYRFALALRGARAWETDRDGQWALYLEATQCEFNNAQHARVAEMIGEARAQVRSPLDRVALFELEIRFAIARNDQNAAIALALEALACLGITFASDTPGLAEQAAQLRREVSAAMGDIAALEQLSEMHDAEHLAAVRIMVGAAGAAYVMRPPLWEVLTLRLVKVTLQHGSSPLAAFGYGFYAVLLAAVYQRIDDGYAFGQLSMRVLEHYGAEPLRAKIVNLFDVFVRHWKEHLRNSLDSLPRGLQSGIDHGDFEYGSYNAIQHGKHRLICGVPLDEVIEQQNAYMRVIDRLNMGYHLDFARIWRQLALNLSGRAADPRVLAGEDYDAAALLPRLVAESSNFLVFNILCTQSMLRYLLGDHQAALAAADTAVEYANYVPGMAELAEHNFFHSLCLLASLRRGDGVHNRRQLRRVAHNQRQLGLWAQHAPMNFLHKWELVAAERLRRSSRPHRAAAAYERAIQGARAHWYLNDQALAAELYAEHLLEQGQEMAGAMLLREARHLYGSWKASEKVRQLGQRHADLLAMSVDSATAHLTQSLTSAIDFDVQSALRASLAIASETDPIALKRALMRIVAENAGAERGMLALKEDAGWLLVARFGPEGLELPAELPLDEVADIAREVLSQAAGSRETLLLDDACGGGGFEHDPYISAQRVRSAMCVPLMYDNQAVGLLYLENRDTPRAFAPSSVKVIEILASQVIVAIQRARLLTTLEQRVEARTLDLRRAQTELERANASLASSEERFRLAMLGTGEGLFDWHPGSGALYLSPGWKRMLGFADDELGNDYETWRQRIHEDDRAGFFASLDALLAAEAESFELECRLLHKRGDCVQVVMRGHIVRDASGAAVRVVGSNIDVTEQRNAQAAIQHQALHDPLTGLPNRALFQDRLGTAINELRRNGRPFCLHLLDLDRFKQINDTLGHLVGDEVLRQTAERIRALLRSTDTAARLGGDEFAIIQLDAADAGSALALAEKLIPAISEPIKLGDITTGVGCSIGIRIAMETAADADTLMSQADVALYRSKSAGRGVATVHAQSEEDHVRHEAQLASWLTAAIDQNQLFLEFQPEVALHSGAEIGLECLLRWRHPEKGVLSASAFVPGLEQRGLAEPLNRWVVTTAARHVAGLQATGIAGRMFTVNLSFRRLLPPGFAARVIECLRQAGAEPARFTFEFMESLFDFDPDAVQRELAQLRAAGSSVAIRGVGLHPMSLLLIRRWKIDKLKLAPEIIARLPTDPDLDAVVRAIVAMARTIGVTVAATRVETCAERHAALHSGCGAAQGFLVGSPAIGAT